MRPPTLCVLGTLPRYFRVPTRPRRRCHWLPADGGNRAMGYGVLGLTGSPTGLTNHKLDKDSCVERSCRLCQLHCIGRVHTMLATPHPVHFEKLSSIGPRSVAGLETTRERAVPRSFLFETIPLASVHSILFPTRLLCTLASCMVLLMHSGLVV